MSEITSDAVLRRRQEVDRLYDKARHDEAQALYHAEQEGFIEGFVQGFLRVWNNAEKQASKEFLCQIVNSDHFLDRVAQERGLSQTQTEKLRSLLLAQESDGR